MPRVVDALATIRSSRFDLPLTYAAEAFELQIGDVVRVPLGNREVLAYVVTAPYDAPPDPKRKSVLERLDVPRAFDDEGLHLARFVSEYYICTLGEALSAAVLAGAVPRTIDSFVRTVAQPNPQRYPSVPSRLVRLIWEELSDGFALETLLRHSDARRAGDRGALLRYVQTLVRSGELRRERRFVQPKTTAYRVRVLYPGEAAIRGSKAQALVAFVCEQPGVPRADALLAGFSNAVIARTVKAGALDEREIEPAHTRSYAPIGDAAFPPTVEQRAALERLDTALDARAFAELLLFGVTGSGKTYVYVEAIKRVVREGGRAIVLVPEISLTPQTARRFEESFGDRVAVLHSALSERERFDAWQACARGEIDVVVGARSAIFAPLRDVRLCVVDEAHETSYKQETVPRYHAVTVARERMRAAGGVLVLGSATPPLESYEAALRGKIELVTMRERATAQPMPTVHIVDLAEEFESGNKRIFSSMLAEALGERIARGEKTVLFVNRRGSGGFVLCRSCGHVPQCPRCDTSLTAHRSEGLLRCHYCDFQMPLP
ncbi:MAG: primosomal protein N', partial [Candidatus Aquilonibacter sp.]